MLCAAARVPKMMFPTVSCIYKTGVLQQWEEIYNGLCLFLNVQSSSDVVWALFLPLASRVNGVRWKPVDESSGYLHGWLGYDSAAEREAWIWGTARRCLQSPLASSQGPSC